MEGKDAIIAKILSDAEKKAGDLIHDAEVYAVSVKEQAEEWAKNYSDEQEKILKTDARDVVERRKIVAELDVRKAVLLTKQQILDKIYARAEEKLCQVDKKTYLKIVLKKIEEFADEGDEVVLSCDGVLKDKDLTESAVFKAKKLSVAKIQGKFKGGVMLLGKTSDKDLTFHEIVSAEKEKTAHVLAKKLFG